MCHVTSAQDMSYYNVNHFTRRVLQSKPNWPTLFTLSTPCRPHARINERNSRLLCALATRNAHELPPGVCSPGSRLQQFDFTMLAACTFQLKQNWCPSKVDHVQQVDSHTIALNIRGLDESTWLYLSWHPMSGHFGLGERPLRLGVASEAFPFGEQLKSQLKGLILSEATIPVPWERVLRLAFAERPSSPVSHVLYCEIMSRYSNLVLTNGFDGSVLAAGYQVGGKMSSLRQVQVGGSTYSLPPPAYGIDPTQVNGVSHWRDILIETGKRIDKPVCTLKDACTRAFRGVSPGLVDRFCHAASVQSEMPVEKISAVDAENLYQYWNHWIDAVLNEALQPIRLQNGFSVMLGDGELVGKPVEDILTSVRTYYDSRREVDHFNETKARICKGIQSALTRTEKKLESLKNQGAQGDKHLLTQKCADLWMANLHSWSPGMNSIMAEDWESGQMVSLSIDKERTALEMAEGLYKQARKQRRAAQQIAPLMQSAMEQLEYLMEAELMLAQLENTDDLPALLEMEVELASNGFVKALVSDTLASKAASKARKAQKRSGTTVTDGLRRFTSPNGNVVLVGRNSRQNDDLTMRIAQDGDVWMHARGLPGAHVILRLESGHGKPEDEDIQFAADIAAWFSKARTDGRVEITCANPKDISKPKGAKPGQVLVRKEWVVVGRPSGSAAAKVVGDD